VVLGNANTVITMNYQLWGGFSASGSVMAVAEGIDMGAFINIAESGGKPTVAAGATSMSISYFTITFSGGPSWYVRCA
jgi:hypothetical protein